MHIPDPLTRREALSTGVTLFAVPFASATLELRARADEVLSRPEVTEAPLPVISIIADGGLSQRDSFDAKEHPRDRYDSGIETYAPDTQSDLVFSTLFRETGSISRKLAVFRTMQCPGIQGNHNADSEALLLDVNGENWHERLAAHTQDSGHPYYYVPAPHRYLGVKTNEQGPGLRRENHPYHRIDQSFTFEPDTDQSATVSEDLQRLRNRENLLQELEHSGLSGSAVSRHLEHRRMALRLLLRESAGLVADPDESVRERYGSYGIPFYYAGQLVANGAKSVALRVGSWDFHFGLVQSMNSNGPRFDKAFAALVRDIDTGNLPPCVVSVCSEFGREPDVDGDPPGRDHWKTSTGILYGGKTVPGVYGETDDHSEPKSGDVIPSGHWRHMVFRAAGYEQLIPEDVPLPPAFRSMPS